jgi:hypothetical protein
MSARRTAVTTSMGLLAVAGWTTGVAASPAAASTLTCARQPSIVQTAPATGGAAVTVTASPAGTSQVSQPTAGALAVTGTPTANSGWAAHVSIASGARVRVVYHSSTSTAVDRYTSSLSATGTKLITHVVSCS